MGPKPWGPAEKRWKQASSGGRKSGDPLKCTRDLGGERLSGRKGRDFGWSTVQWGGETCRVHLQWKDRTSSGGIVLPSQSQKHWPRIVLEPQLTMPKCYWKRDYLTKVPTHLWAQVRSTFLFKFLAQEEPALSHQDTGTNEQVGTGSIQFLSSPWSWPCATALHAQILPEENWSPRNTGTQVCRGVKSQPETAIPANT